MDQSGILLKTFFYLQIIDFSREKNRNRLTDHVSVIINHNDSMSTVYDINLPRGDS